MKLVQYQIERDLPQKDFIRIAKRFLSRDRSWHFFHERSYSLVRCERRIPALERWLARRKMKFNVNPKYEDPHCTVRKYQDLFIPIFHSYTMLGLFGEDEEFRTLFNRVVHCFANMCGAPAYAEAMSSMNHSLHSIFMMQDHQFGLLAVKISELENELKTLKPARA